MKKLLAIWRIIKADKWAVFTFEETAPDPTWLKVPNFFWFIKQRLKNIEENKKTYSLDDLIRKK